MLGTVVTFFFVCLLPFRALIVWIVLAPHEEVMKLGNEGYYSLLYFCRIMFYLNSATNPILYNLMSSKFRNGFLKLCGIKKNYFGKHKKALLRTSTFNTSSLTAITSSSVHRPSIADLNHKDRKKSFLDTSYKRDVTRRNSCSKSLLLRGEFSSDSKSLRLKGFVTKTNCDKKKSVEKCHFKINQIGRRKVSRRKSFSDFLIRVEKSNPVLNHSQSVDSIFKKMSQHSGKKATFKRGVGTPNNNDEIISVIKKSSNKHISGFLRTEKAKNLVVSKEDDQIFKIFNSNKRNKPEEFKESFV